MSIGLLGHYSFAIQKSPCYPLSRSHNRGQSSDLDPGLPCWWWFTGAQVQETAVPLQRAPF